MNDFFNENNPLDEEVTDNDITTYDEDEQGFLELVHRALNSKQSDFVFIRSWEHRSRVKLARFGYYKIYTSFKKLYTRGYKEYIKHVTEGTQDFDSLIIIKDLKRCMDFYLREAQVVEDCLAEHWEYMMSGHLFDTLVGNIRPEEDLWDHRRRGRYEE